MLALALALAFSEPRTVRVPVAPAETLTVLIQGAGTPVVMIPGLFGSAYTYRTVASLLADAGYLTIVIEPLAMGSSSRPRGADYSLWAQAERVAAVLDTLHVRAAIVIGHSASASIAYRVAIRRPELVSSIVSIEGGPTEAAATPGFRRAMTMAPLIRLAGTDFVRGRIRRGMIAASGDTSWVTDEVIGEYTSGATANLSATLRAYLRMADAREGEPLAPRLGELRCPVVLLMGAAVHSGSPSALERALMGRSIPAFRTEWVAGAGHYLQEERPDVVVAAVRRFAAETALAAAR